MGRKKSNNSLIDKLVAFLKEKRKATPQQIAKHLNCKTSVYIIVAQARQKGYDISSFKSGKTVTHYGFIDLDNEEQLSVNTKMLDPDWDKLPDIVNLRELGV